MTSTPHVMNPEEQRIAADVAAHLRPTPERRALAARGVPLCVAIRYPGHVAVVCSASAVSTFAPLDKPAADLARQLDAALG